MTFSQHQTEARTKNPSWLVNLQKNSNVVIRVRNKKLNAVAVPVDRTYRSDLWDQLISSLPFYSNYQTRTRREIPMVRLRVK
ncbi:MAG: nitroreductase family deazaflavin-dependent oxidoreductase [Dehalococcoidia bacterium]|nr:nitroreductase family deazaflavin-dependent oxidoreductase [Dehalococcoidia bacterium]